VRVEVLGFDGATFDLLGPMIERGLLPHLGAAIRDGASGPLRSTVPPLSAQAWSTFQTGVNPGKHSVFDFNRYDPATYGIHPINSTMLKAPPLWSILSARGRRCGVLNMMFTYPPQALNGFVVTGKETPGEDKAYTGPASLKEEILKFEPRYHVDPFREISMGRQFLKAIPKRLARQERVNQFLLDRYPVDFSASLFAMPDVLHHIFWKDMDPKHPMHDARQAKARRPLIDRAFQALDRIAGERMSRLKADDLLIVMSDHGAGPHHRTVQINRWLRQQGLLATKPRARSDDSVLRAWLRRAAKRIYTHLLPFDFCGVRRRIAHARLNRSRQSLNDAIDWTATRAFAGTLGEHGVHCNLRGRDGMGIVEPGPEYEELRDRMIAGLSSLRDPVSGAKVLEGVYRREALYHGPHVAEAPDLILDFGEGPYLPGDALWGDAVIADVDPMGLSGMHRPCGVLIATGGGARKGARIEDARIVDLAPTILYALGEEVPRWMDGRVLTGLLDEGFVRDHPVRIGKELLPAGEAAGESHMTEEEEAEVQSRLKDLGYL
jgi:predicted AlkP superfamily phosphohydrolase/phosphomutase